MRRGNFSLFIPFEGCPYHCIYCDQRKISGQNDMSPAIAADTLAREMPRWKERGMRGQIAFFGGTFTGLPTEQMCAYLSAAQPYVQSGMVDGIRISTRPDCISDEILLLLKEYGVTHIELGVQSMDDQVLAAAGRGYTADIVANSARRIREHGFVLGLQMMPGLPDDTPQKSVDTARSIIELGAAETRIYPTLVIRGTPLQKLYNEGKYQQLSFESALDQTARLKMMFEDAGVTVLKVGLHSGAVEQDVVAGPFHPAFGQLVDSRICLDKLICFCEQNKLQNTELFVLPQHYDISTIFGQRKENCRILQEKYNISIKNSKKLLTNTRNFIIL